MSTRAAVATASDPWASIRRVGYKASQNGIWAGLVIAFFSHIAAAESPKYTMIPMREVVRDMRREVHSYVFTRYDIQIVEAPPEEKPKPEPVEEPEPEPEEPAPEEPEPELEEPEPDLAEPPPPQDNAEEDSPYDDYEEPPPAAAQAADVLTQDSDEPVDMTDNTFVDADGSRESGGGETSGTGTKKGPQIKSGSRGGVQPGGNGKPSSTGKVRRRPKKSRARGAKPLGGSSWSNCPFPPQADVEQIDKAVATVAVTVGPDGRARSARVVSDPGYGFGAMAKRCALGQRYRAALNFDGSPITATTPPIRVFFRR